MADDSQIPAHAGTEGLSHLPFDRGLRRLLANRQDELERCRQRFLGSEDNGEALHDLRVATRRLRSLLGGYRCYLQGRKRLAAELRALQQASNPARDLEVFISRIQACAPTTAPLIPALQQQLDDHYRQLRDYLPEAWQQLGPSLQSVGELVQHDIPTTPLGGVCADEARRHFRRLKKGLTALRKHWDDRSAHRLRIIGKRLRYLLEPFTDITEVKEAVGTLKRFQDCLGDYHDSDLLQQRIASWHPPSPLDATQILALEALRTQLQNEHRQLRRNIREVFLQGGRKAFLRQLRLAMHALRQ